MAGMIDTRVGLFRGCCVKNCVKKWDRNKSQGKHIQAGLMSVDDTMEASQPRPWTPRDHDTLPSFPFSAQSSQIMDVPLTMSPTEATYVASRAPSMILATSPVGRNRDRPVASTRDEHDHVELSSCQESYRLFKRCSMSDKTVGYSCSDAVARYMRCALNDCREG
jgi:hypothetical protein